MDDKKRTIYAVLVAVVVILGLLYSFGMNFFSQPPQIVLPDPEQSDVQETEPGSIGDAAGTTVRVEPGTVQSVIARMSRYESYSRTVSVTYSWSNGETETVTSQVWEDGGWVRTDTQFPSGMVESSITDGAGIWVWYPDEGRDETPFYSACHGANADLLQHLPTYEDVLELHPENITDAGYVEHEGHSCIYVEAEQKELGYLYRYWISINSGLLMTAETEKAGRIVYRMTSNEVISPLGSVNNLFTLPDGTVLYGMG